MDSGAGCCRPDPWVQLGSPPNSWGTACISVCPALSDSRNWTKLAVTRARLLAHAARCCPVLPRWKLPVPPLPPGPLLVP